jgi:hypothetical protein
MTGIAHPLPVPFRLGQVLPNPALTPSPGPLAAFTGTFTGSGFSTVFRPDLGSPTVLPVPLVALTTRLSS